MARCPKTAAEAFKRLDKRLSKEEKKAIRQAEDVSEFHFGLGMWIRNYWIHGGETENLAMLLTDLGEKGTSVGEGDEKFYFIMPPDMVSGIILEAYQKHLKDSIGI